MSARFILHFGLVLWYKRCATDFDPVPENGDTMLNCILMVKTPIQLVFGFLFVSSFVQFLFSEQQNVNVNSTSSLSTETTEPISSGF